MGEEIEIQTIDEVKNIDYMKANSMKIEQVMNEQSTQTEVISEALNNIQDSIDSQPEVDFSEVTELIENIDTTVVEVQTQDILSTVNNQQSQIDDIKASVDEINDKLNQILKKL